MAPRGRGGGSRGPVSEREQGTHCKSSRQLVAYYFPLAYYLLLGLCSPKLVSCRLHCASLQLLLVAAGAPGPPVMLSLPLAAPLQRAKQCWTLPTAALTTTEPC